MVYSRVCICCVFPNCCVLSCCLLHCLYFFWFVFLERAMTGLVTPCSHVGWTELLHSAWAILWCTVKDKSVTLRYNNCKFSTVYVVSHEFLFLIPDACINTVYCAKYTLCSFNFIQPCYDCGSELMYTRSVRITVFILLSWTKNE